jgi:hypothetical protein
MLFRQWCFQQWEWFAGPDRKSTFARRTSGTCNISKGEVLVLQKWKKGRGEKEIWIEERLSAQLEEAWSKGQAMLKLRDGEFHWEYDLVEMTQTWFEPDGPRHSKPIYRKVDTKIMQ